MFIISSAFERYAALYTLLKKNTIYEQLSFLFHLTYRLQRVHLFVREKINHREAPIFDETNLTNARMVEGERIDRF